MFGFMGKNGGVDVYKPGFDVEAYKKRQAFSTTFPPLTALLTVETLEANPKLAAAFQEFGAQLVKQYAPEVDLEFHSVVGVRLVGIDFMLILGRPGQ